MASFDNKRIPVAVSVVALFGLTLAINGAAWAQLATDLVCANPAGCVHASDLVDGSVLPSKIPTASIGTIKLRNNAVVTMKIADAAVTSAKIAPNAVNGARIADGSVTGADIADGSISGADVADGTIAGADIANGSIAAADIAAGAVNSGHIADGTVASADIADNSITGVDIANGTVASADIASGAVGSSHIADGTVTGIDLAANAVSSAHILNGTIANADISAAAAIAASKIFGDAGLDFLTFSNFTNIPAGDNAVKNMGSVSITCPTAGYVVVILAGEAVFFGDGTNVNVGVSTSSGVVPDATSVRVGRHDGTSNNRFNGAFTALGVFGVGAGTSTFYAVAQTESVFDRVSVNVAPDTMAAIFIPKRY